MSSGPIHPVSKASGILRRLARDRSGNTLALLAAAVIPLLGLVGGGVDLGRAYLSQSRLQQACDAGVLAARKRLTADAAVTQEIDENVAKMGHRFFNINFRDGSFGTRDRSFVMTLESDYAISGDAKVTVDTTLMQVFGTNQIELAVECEAQINFADTDVMMVLDVTGSMAQNNPGDSASRMSVLKTTIKDFHKSLNASAKAGTQIRYGFVPYSTNVNVGHLLEDDWVTTEWAYSSRRLLNLGGVGTKSYYTASSPVSGSRVETQHENYTAKQLGNGTYRCDKAPNSNVTTSTILVEETSEDVTGPPAGTRTQQDYQRTYNGVSYSVSLDGSTCSVIRTEYDDYILAYSYITEPSYDGTGKWLYDWLYWDVSDWRTESNGCIEERQTYEITDYDNVNFNRALDLNLDLVPTNDPRGAGLEVTERLIAESQIHYIKYDEILPESSVTKWRPMFPKRIYGRAKRWDGVGDFHPRQRLTGEDYIAPIELNTTACPAPSQKLQTMTEGELDSYLNTLVPVGSTYHDVGMIWGGRLISPTGLFRSENAGPINRNLIFLTDGETSPLDISYSAYGMEPVDRRRWSPDSDITLAETIEKRFSVACREVRNRGIKVWVIGFGIELTDAMRECAGEGRYFEAADGAELNATFGAIAKNVADLRITN